jgi:hypothetical protein
MPAPIASEQSVDPLTELLGQVKRASGGRLLALHTDLARSPAVLAAYLVCAAREATTRRWPR